MKTVCVEYVNFPSDGNWDLGSIENPTHTTVKVVALLDRPEAAEWMSETNAQNRAIFPLRALTPACRARARRAARTNEEYFYSAY